MSRKTKIKIKDNYTKYEFPIMMISVLFGLPLLTLIGQ